MMKCKFSYIEQGEPVGLQDLGKCDGCENDDYRSYLDTCIASILKVRITSRIYVTSYCYITLVWLCMLHGNPFRANAKFCLATLSNYNSKMAVFSGAISYSFSPPSRVFTDTHLTSLAENSKISYWEPQNISLGKYYCFAAASISDQLKKVL